MLKELAEISLTDNDRQTITAAAGILKERFPVDKVILYGSKARGDDHADSDIDLFVITSRPIQWRERKSIVAALFDLAMATDTIINILTVPLADWATGAFRHTAIYREILRDGVPAA
ncbi:MAG: nucleotidyltransferase domain-containing protein [Deltaproteobacteria bacterium]|nr:nucleotidyltransferase domain-containing protein [Deltaproteobacteria bacterium]